MKVALFITCLVDQLAPQVGEACVEVLRRAGCDVAFDTRQTCCGQPAFNTGYRAEARKLARRQIEIFEDADCDYIVSPSGSCTAMTHHYRTLFDDDARMLERAERLAAHTFEFSAFLVRVLQAEDLGARFPFRVTWHDACHALRELAIKSEPRTLLKAVRELELVETANAESCCGFGGTFSVKYPEISIAILDSKLALIEKANIDYVASVDASCLMHIAGRLARRESNIKTVHLAEILASQ